MTVIYDDTPDGLHLADHPSLNNLTVLKSSDSLGVFSAAGNILREPRGATGFYKDDTRILSQWHFKVEGAEFHSLVSETDEEGLVLTTYAGNSGFSDAGGRWVAEHTLYLAREKFIQNETVYERIVMHNVGMEPVSMRANIFFAADFKDMFEVRGLERDRHGGTFEQSVDAKGAFFRYCGLDKVDRYCRIRFYLQPGHIDSGSAHYDIELAPQEKWELVCKIDGESEPGPERCFEEALALARENLVLKKSGWRRIVTDNEVFNDWFKASENVVSILMTDKENGFYPYAGLPWFSVPFGRDGIITALQTLPFNPSIARGVLSYLAATQAGHYDPESEAEPGKILHETRAGEMANTGEVAFKRYYGSVDGTPLFVMLAAAYYTHSGDLDFIRSLMPSLEAALGWIDKDGDRDGDGFVEYAPQSEHGLSTQCWKDSFDSISHESGMLAPPPIAMCEVQGYIYAAWQGMAVICRALGQSDKAALLSDKAAALYQKFNDAFWIEDKGIYALALDRDKKPCAVVSSNLGHLLYCGIVPEDRAKKLAAVLTGSKMFTGYGIRTLAEGAARYNPMSYHNGSVWPHDTAIAAAGLARYGYREEAARIVDSLLSAAQRFPRMILPELYCGFARKQTGTLAHYPAACIQQAWAAGAAYMCLSALVGEEALKAGKLLAVPPHASRFFSFLQIK